MVQVRGDIDVPEMKEGQRPEVNAIIELKDIVFPKPGRYQFSVLVDKDFKGDLAIDVHQKNMIGSKNSGG
jgi:hypothetical protein